MQRVPDRSPRPQLLEARGFPDIAKDAPGCAALQNVTEKGTWSQERGLKHTPRRQKPNPLPSQRTLWESPPNPNGSPDELRGLGAPGLPVLPPRS